MKKKTRPKTRKPAGAGTDREREPVDPKTAPRLAFTVVGIGASAGGLEALLEFFKACPEPEGFAYVVVQHLPPDKKEMLSSILARSTTMSVAQVTDGVKVEPNHVYVIRPGRTLTIQRGHLHLGESVTKPPHRRPVDDFFRSLAAEQQQRSVCVILSGMGSNGTSGAEAIRAVGGLCIAQDPDTAKYPEMPRALIESGLADFVLSPQEMPAAISSYNSHPYARGVPLAQEEAEREQEALEEILGLVRSRVRHDFSAYRKPTIIRRIQRRMGVNQIASMAAYVYHLRQTPSELHVLADDLLIHVTGFFRDPDAWRALQAKVIEPLVAKRADGAGIRAWVTACSSGEEAYSLAMLLMEAAEAANKHFDIKVFATDTAERSLMQARAGVFPGGIESEVSAERLKKFFRQTETAYQIRKEVRDLVVFAPQNILQDPPFSLLDICTCRNFLIYIEPDVQRRVLELLHFSLNEGGALLLGNSESISGTESRFETIDRLHRIFRRTGPSRRGANALPVTSPMTARTESRPAETSIDQVAKSTLLDNFGPAGVVIDRQQQMVYFHGDIERFVDVYSDDSNRDLVVLARPFVRAAVADLLQRARASEKREILRKRVRLPGRKKAMVEVSMIPVRPGSKGADHLICFTEISNGTARAPAPSPRVMSRQNLIDDLKSARSELQRTVLDLRASNDEMKAAHEETISVNEELQSTNEELETSKEELQSLNEELTTVNAQLQVKMEELEGSTNDMASLLKSTDIAVLFLDRDLRIRRFTPAVKDLFELIPTDVGRPLTDLALKFSDPGMLKEASTTLATGQPVEKEVISHSGRIYVRRVLPYRNTTDNVEGVVLTFVDITGRKSAEMAMRQSENRHRLILEGIREYGIFMLDSKGRFVTWTPAAERILGYTAAEAQGKDLNLILTAEDQAAGLAERDLESATRDGNVLIERWNVRKDGSRFWATGILTRLNDEAGHPYGFVKVVRDNTDRKAAEDELRKAVISAEAANASKDHFLANVSHELRTPLSATTLWARLLSEQKEIDPELLREGLDAINRSTEEQRALIEDLMDTAKIVAGKMRLEPRDFDLNRLMRALLPPLRSVAVEKQLVIDEVLDPAVGAVTGDPRRVQQVVANLVNNAIKFTPHGGRITVRTARAGDEVEIRVTDTGKGIQADALTRIFERFVQVDQDSIPVARGMGLGLAIAKQLVEMHGGTIRAMSDGPGTGSTFVIVLPMPRLADLGPEAAIPQLPMASLDGWRVLVVEDDTKTRNALETVLSEAGAEVMAASTKKDALAKFTHARPDVILSDIGLGPCSGHELIAEIRKREKSRGIATTPALALTAYADETNRRKAFESGFQDCAIKPIEPIELVDKLVNLGSGR